MAETITSLLPAIRPSSGWRDKCCNRAAKARRNETPKQSTRAANRPILVLQSQSAFHWHAQRMRLLRPCQLAVFSVKLPSMEAELDDKLPTTALGLPMSFPELQSIRLTDSCFTVLD